MLRKEQIKAENTNDVITIEVYKEKEVARISFDFTLETNISPIFLLPNWAKSKFEEVNLSGGVIFLPGKNGVKKVKINVSGNIKKHIELKLSTTVTGNYSGNFEYSLTPSEQRGIIINGIRINSISTIDTNVFGTMLSIVRNHQGELISSSTFDSKRKKKFTINTIVMFKDPYEAEPGVIINSILEFEKVLYGTHVGEWIMFVMHGTKFKTLLTGEVNEKLVKVSMNGVIQLGKTYSFTLEEV